MDMHLTEVNTISCTAGRIYFVLTTKCGDYSSLMHNHIKEFWNDRANRFGHTGYKDGFIYAYDQQARLSAIELVLRTVSCGRSTALDFGCGAGDFSNLLAKHFEKVIAFDISDAVTGIAEGSYAAIENIRFLSGGRIEEIGVRDASIDLILSITVLDHIVDDLELDDTLRYFYRVLHDNGFVIALESACDNERPSTSYKKFTSFKQWNSLFSDRGFSLDAYYQFCDPIECPCGSYQGYRKSVGGIKGAVLRLLMEHIDRKAVELYLRRLARERLWKKDDFIWKEGATSSPIKLMVFKKRQTQKC